MLKALFRSLSFWLSLIFCLFANLIFIIFPKIDYRVATFFFDRTTLLFFQSNWMDVVRIIFSWLVIATIVGLVLSLLITFFKKRTLNKKVLGVLLCFILGPGLIVNLVLKDYWGRPRPEDLVQFSGPYTYQKPWVIGKQCSTNCSFVAGEPATAFTFFALLILIKKRNWQYLAGVGVTLLWVLISFIRIAQGGHFLSDVIIGATLIYMLIYGCYAKFRN